MQTFTCKIVMVCTYRVVSDRPLTQDRPCIMYVCKTVNVLWTWVVHKCRPVTWYGLIAKPERAPHTKKTVTVKTKTKIWPWIQDGARSWATDQESSFSELKYKRFCKALIPYIPWYDTGHIENHASNNPIVACVFVTAVTFLPSRCLATIGGFLPNRAVA
jgi:hypothetical protein